MNTCVCACEQIIDWGYCRFLHCFGDSILFSIPLGLGDFLSHWSMQGSVFHSLICSVRGKKQKNSASVIISLFKETVCNKNYALSNILPVLSLG